MSSPSTITSWTPITPNNQPKLADHLIALDNVMTVQLPLWTPLETKDSPSPPKDKNVPRELLAVQDVQPSFLVKNTALEWSSPSQDHISPLSPETVSPVTDPLTVSDSILKSRSRVFHFDGVVIPRQHVRFKEDGSGESTSPQSHHPTISLKPSRKRYDITTTSSIAAALAQSFANNGLETLPLAYSPLPGSLPPKKLQKQQTVSQSSPHEYRNHISRRLQDVNQVIDQGLDTVVAQVMYTADKASNLDQSGPFRLPFPGRDFQSIAADSDYKLRRPGVISEDRGRVAGFVDRLERWFGPGDIQRGSGRKPIQRNQVPANASESDAGVVSEAPIQVHESVAGGLRPNKRKQAESDDQDETRASKPKTESDSVSVTVATEWAQILQKLAKGKVAVTKQELRKMEATIDLIEKIEISAEVLKESGLDQRILQLAKLQEIPTETERGLRRKAKRLVASLEIENQA